MTDRLTGKLEDVGGAATNAIGEPKRDLESDVKPRDLGALEKAVNETAGKATTTWVGFLSLATYLALTTGSVTHEDLFLENSITLPVLNAKLPLSGYFALAPLFFLVSHFYALLQLHGLAGKVADYSAMLREALPDDGERRLIRQRLDSFVFVQLLAGTRERRQGLVGALHRIVAWITMVGFPLVVLLQLQLAYLPYQDQGVTWLHRLAVLADVLLLSVFWRQIALGRPSSVAERRDKRWLALIIRTDRWRRWRRAAAVALIFFSWFVARFPGEHVYPNERNSPLSRLTRVLFEGTVNEVAGKPNSPFANRLVLSDKDFIDDEKLKKLDDASSPDMIRSFRGRSLRQAVLIRTDLRRSDFSAAELQAANLSYGRFTQSRFKCADTGKRRPYESEPEAACAQLQGARLIGAELNGANFERAEMQDADFSSAHLVGAVFFRASLMDAELWNARLQGANLVASKLQGASFRIAQMQGAELGASSCQGANFAGAQLQGSDLRGAFLQGANFQLAQMHGADLSGANLQGAGLDQAQLQGADIGGANLLNASLCGAELRRNNKAGTQTEFSRFAKLRPSRISLHRMFATRSTTLEHVRLKRLLLSIVPAPTDRRALGRLTRLAPNARSRAEDRIERLNWEASEGASPNASSFVAGWAGELGDLACQADGSVVRGLIRNGLLAATGPHLEAIVARLRDRNSCSGAEGVPTEWYTMLLANPATEHCGAPLSQLPLPALAPSGPPIPPPPPAVRPSFQ